MEVLDEYEELPEGTSTLVNLSAGALAGIFEHTITFPLDSLKTRMQSSSSLPAATLAAHIRHVASSEGLGKLWRGIWSVVIGAGPAHAIYFASYEQCKKFLLPAATSAATNEFTRALALGASGAVATVLSDAVMTPFDVIKQRLQLNQHKNLLTCVRSIIRTEGISALYISYPTTLILNVPFHVIQFPTYELAQDVLNPHRSYSPLMHCLSGALAGGVAAAATTPIDSVKTVLQTRGLLPAAEASKIRGTLSAAQFIIKRRGYGGLWAGVTPRILANMPATAACWTIYELFHYNAYTSPATSLCPALRRLMLPCFWLCFVPRMVRKFCCPNEDDVREDDKNTLPPPEAQGQLPAAGINENNEEAFREHKSTITTTATMASSKEIS